MRALTTLVAVLVLSGCAGESEEPAQTAPATAPGSGVGATGTDATATPVAGDTATTNAAHP